MAPDQLSGRWPVGVKISEFHDPEEPLTLPSPARGEGFQNPSLDGRGKGEGDNLLKIRGRRRYLKAYG